MPTLPVHPHLDQLRRRAKELLRAAVAGDPEALQSIELVSDRLTLASTQLALARSYGFPSWRALKAEVDARTLDLAARADALARYGFATAVVLGDASRMRAELDRDPGLANRTDPRRGWSAQPSPEIAALLRSHGSWPRPA